MTVRIALVIPTLSSGGAERVASVIANTWAEYHRCEVHIITFAGRARFFELSPGVRHFEAGGASGRGGALRLLSLMLRIRRYIKANKIGSVLSFMDVYNIFMIGTLAFSGVRLTVSDRSSPNRPRRVWFRILKRLSYLFADGVIAQTYRAADAIRSQTWARRVDVIPNPVRKVQPRGPREKLVLSVGRLVPEKGQDHLVRAFCALESNDWRLAIVGEGPLRARLEALLTTNELKQRVLLPGNSSDVDHWYSRASIFVLPSILEGFPNALIEAMAHGLPCISYDCVAGPSEIISDGRYGVLVPPGDEEGLKNALDELMANQALRSALGEAAKSRARDFESRSICLQYLQICISSREFSELSLETSGAER